MNITCSNQTRKKIDCRPISRSVKRYLKNKNSRLISVTLAIIGQKRIQALNQSFRSIDSSTDILTFIHQLPHGLVGEIYLNPQSANKKGYRLVDLVRHGLDHCLGQHH